MIPQDPSNVPVTPTPGAPNALPNTLAPVNSKTDQKAGRAAGPALQNLPSGAAASPIKPLPSVLPFMPVPSHIADDRTTELERERALLIEKRDRVYEKMASSPFQGNHDYDTCVHELSKIYCALGDKLEECSDQWVKASSEIAMNKKAGRGEVVSGDMYQSLVNLKAERKKLEKDRDLAILSLEEVELSLKQKQVLGKLSKLEEKNSSGQPSTEAKELKETYAHYLRELSASSLLVTPLREQINKAGGAWAENTEIQTSAAFLTKQRVVIKTIEKIIEYKEAASNLLNYSDLIPRVWLKISELKTTARGIEEALSVQIGTPSRPGILRTSQRIKSAELESIQEKLLSLSPSSNDSPFLSPSASASASASASSSPSTSASTRATPSQKPANPVPENIKKQGLLDALFASAVEVGSIIRNFQNEPQENSASSSTSPVSAAASASDLLLTVKPSQEFMEVLDIHLNLLGKARSEIESNSQISPETNRLLSNSMIAVELGQDIYEIHQTLNRSNAETAKMVAERNVLVQQSPAEEARIIEEAMSVAEATTREYAAFIEARDMTSKEARIRGGAGTRNIPVPGPELDAFVNAAKERSRTSPQKLEKAINEVTNKEKILNSKTYKIGLLNEKLKLGEFSREFLSKKLEKMNPLFNLLRNPIAQLADPHHAELKAALSLPLTGPVNLRGIETFKRDKPGVMTNGEMDFPRIKGLKQHDEMDGSVLDFSDANTKSIKELIMGKRSDPLIFKICGVMPDTRRSVRVGALMADGSTSTDQFKEDLHRGTRLNSVSASTFVENSQGADDKKKVPAAYDKEKVAAAYDERVQPLINDKDKRNAIYSILHQGLAADAFSWVSMAAIKWCGQDDPDFPVRFMRSFRSHEPLYGIDVTNNLILREHEEFSLNSVLFSAIIDQDENIDKVMRVEITQLDPFNTDDEVADQCVIIHPAEPYSDFLIRQQKQ